LLEDTEVALRFRVSRRVARSEHANNGDAPARSKTSRRTSEHMQENWEWLSPVGLFRRAFGPTIPRPRKRTTTGTMRQRCSGFITFL
jgi:hypothetical protein